MCGISITKDPEGYKSTAHRGIETTVIYKYGMTIAHHRLPIQTRLNDNYQQPIQLDDNVFLLYNGELFDFPEEFDNDVGYIEWLWKDTMSTVMFFEKLNTHDGFWAIVLILNDRVIFGTDYLGKKLLYYNTHGEICSEMRGLITGGINTEYIAEVGAFGYVQGCETPYRAIKRARPGVIYSGLMGKEPQPFFALSEPATPPEFNMEIAVQSRTIGHESIACLVSGGLDSSIIAYHLRENDNVKFYTVDNGEDAEYIPVLSNFINREIEVLKSPILIDLERILTANETPQDLGSMIPQYLLFQVVKEKVVITGDGADELFGGYRRNYYYDSQSQDLKELTYYHLPRIDKLSMWFTKEARQPFLSNSIVAYAKHLPYRMRTNKNILRSFYTDVLPKEIVNRGKEPLKTTAVRNNEKLYRYELIQRFYELCKMQGR